MARRARPRWDSAVLLGRLQLCRRPGVARRVALHRDEHRVVAETVDTRRFSRDPAAPFAAHHPRPRHRARPGRARRRRQRRGARRARRRAEPATARCSRIVAVPTRPARRQHTRHAVQRVHRQAGIVRQADLARVARRLRGLGDRILLERRPGLRFLGEGRDVGQPQHPHPVTQNPLQLGELLRVAGGQQHPAHDLAAWARAFGAGPVPTRPTGVARRHRTRRQRLRPGRPAAAR